MAAPPPPPSPRDIAKAQKDASYAEMDNAKAAMFAKLPSNPGLQGKIDELVDQQTELNLNYLNNATNLTAVNAAVAQIQTATANLKTEAGNIATATKVLNTAAKIVGYATQIVGLFAPFI
jgi:hypothetical protein